MVNNLTTLFKLQIYHVNDLKENINSLILKKLEEEKKLNYKNKKSNVGGFQTNLLPMVNELKLFIGEHVKIYLKNFKLRKKCKYLDVDITSFWINENNNLNYNILHTHIGGGVDLSGVYYVKCPSNSGNICFYNSNHEGTSLVSIFEGFNEYNSVNVNEGDLILFPSSFKHMVEPNLSNESRISISFNLCFNFKISYN
jgi:uncharacterized protein (TIGR02466 family)